MSKSRNDALSAHDLPKEYRQLAEEAIAAGFRLFRTNGDHIAWHAPDGVGLTFSPLTPSDWRGLRNTRSQLQRAGLPRPVKHKKHKRKRASRR
jgi:hypothetical protein